MRWATLLMIAVLCLAVSAPAAVSATASTNRRVALVVGNAAYKHLPTLGNPVRDADLVGGALRSVGFDVQVAKDVDVNRFRSALKQFATTAASADVALIYFAGFGAEIGDEGWLVPVDAQLRSALDLPVQAIRHADVIAAMGSARTKVAVFDASRDNPFQGGSRALTLMASTPPGVMILHSTQDGGVASDGAGGQHSPFALAFATRIVQPRVDLSTALRQVTRDVRVESADTQQPVFYDGATDPVYLAGGPEQGHVPDPANGRLALIEQPRLALVIGVGDYNQDGKITERSTAPGFLRDLRNPRSDAEEMAKALKALQFKVTEAVDVNKDDLLGRIVDWGTEVRNAGPDALVVVYFAGHAVQLNGSNYLLPAGSKAPPQDLTQLMPQDAEFLLGNSAVALNGIFSRLRPPNMTGANIVILDACRDTPWQPRPAPGATAQVPGNPGLAEQQPPLRRTVVFYATQPGHVAEDGEGVHSPFTTAILERIGTPGITVRALFDDVIDAVDRATGGRQLPHISSSSLGGVCLGACVVARETAIVLP